MICITIAEYGNRNQSKERNFLDQSKHSRKKKTELLIKGYTWEAGSCAQVCYIARWLALATWTDHLFIEDLPVVEIKSFIT